MSDAPLEKIETEIDRFYNLMARKGKVKLDEACKELNLEKKHITKYVDVLTRSKKVIAKYPFIGQPYFYLAEDADASAAVIKTESDKKPGQQIYAEDNKNQPDKTKETDKTVKTDEIKEEAKDANKKTSESDKKNNEEANKNNKKNDEVSKEDSQKHCTKCGNPLKPNARFCTKCGTEVKS